MWYLWPNFSVKSNLKRHIVGVHEKKKKFECLYETKKFRLKNFKSHLNDLLESWTEAVCFDILPFWKNFGHKCHIWTVSFPLHAFRKYIFSKLAFESSQGTNLLFSFYEWIYKAQNGSLNCHIFIGGDKWDNLGSIFIF